MSGVRQIFAVRVNQLADWFASGRLHNDMCCDCSAGSYLLVIHIRPSGWPAIIDSGDYNYVAGQLTRYLLSDYDKGWVGNFGYEIWHVVPSDGYYC